MKKNWAYKILDRWGWKIIHSVDIPKKCVICVAPHTSNWDFIVGMFVKYALHIKANFFMKKEWFFFPLGPILRKLGGIAVYRQKNCHMTDSIAAEFNNYDELCVAITPEGTRSLNPDWKKGFYYIAEKANIPIHLASIDYLKKEIHFGRNFIPTGNIDEDIKEIKNFYKDVHAKYPSKFAI